MLHFVTELLTLLLVVVGMLELGVSVSLLCGLVLLRALRPSDERLEHGYWWNWWNFHRFFLS